MCLLLFILRFIVRLIILVIIDVVDFYFIGSNFVDVSHKKKSEEKNSIYDPLP
ncbi:hypothetical protein THF5H11_30654 [Vibrio jasicida]|nr:hypothetical protein THF5H11_30654 [Vibrio jasicida]